MSGGWWVVHPIRENSCDSWFGLRAADEDF